jgi:plasmid stabilization system protein ParE
VKRRIVVRPEARAEFAEAAAWYRSKSEVVAASFRVAVRQTIARISERPRSFVEILPDVRRALTTQFPYAIFYAEENDSIIVLAIKHQAQDPAGWPSGV